MTSIVIETSRGEIALTTTPTASMKLVRESSHGEIQIGGPINGGVMRVSDMRPVLAEPSEALVRRMREGNPASGIVTGSISDATFTFRLNLEQGDWNVSYQVFAVEHDRSRAYLPDGRLTVRQSAGGPCLRVDLTIDDSVLGAGILVAAENQRTCVTGEVALTVAK